jgi:hypothetical protein
MLRVTIKWRSCHVVPSHVEVKQVPLLTCIVLVMFFDILPLKNFIICLIFSIRSANPDTLELINPIAMQGGGGGRVGSSWQAHQAT